MSQPRKIAAITIAQRVAEERSSTLGDLVGYQVGLNKEMDKSEAGRTKILFCTTGVILQRLVHESTMSRYSHIIIDEIHERDIDTDLLLIIVRRLLAVDGPKTKIILMSATFNKDHFENMFRIPTTTGIDYYPSCVDLNCVPRKFDILEMFLNDFKILGIPADCINYAEPGISDDLYRIGVTIVTLCVKQLTTAEKFKAFANGTVLVFLPGIGEIENFYNRLKMAVGSMRQAEDEMLVISILHSSLSSEEQREALNPGKVPKIILSTNIAESGLTILNVTHVIDFCLTKYNCVAKGALLSSLVLRWSTKQNSMQRAGRCGRMCEGTVIRMIHKNYYEHHMDEYPSPEMTRVSLENVVLKMKILGMGSPVMMLALAPNPPEKSSIIDAVLHLKYLGGLSRFDEKKHFDYEDGDLTFLGRIMEALPTDPRIAKFIMIGYLYSVLDEAVIIGAGLNNKSIFINNFGEKLLNYTQRLSWSHESGSDCIAILNAYTLWVKCAENIDFSTNVKIAWCKNNGLDMKNLVEMGLLIKEIQSRLSRFRSSPLSGKQICAESDKIFILKVCMAGAFGPSHFFMPIEHDQNFEREAFKVVDNHDPLRSVIFRNMDRNLIGEVYERQLRDILLKKNIIEKVEDVKITFNHLSSEKVLLEFTRQHGENDGKILREVYKAVKTRQIDRKIELNVMNRDDTIVWAKEHGLGDFSKTTGEFKIKKNLLGMPETCVLPTITVKFMEGFVTHIEHANKIFFMPLKACHETESGEEIDECYSKHINRLKILIKLADKEPLDVSCAEQKVLMISINGEWNRAHFIAKLDDQEVIVKLVDIGSEIKANISDVFMASEATESGLKTFLPRVFECSLSHVTPSAITHRDGKWKGKSVTILRDHILNRPATVHIFSVVNDVVSVSMMMTGSGTHVNTKLVKKGYADVCEENYLSVLNNDSRKQLFKHMVMPKEEFTSKTDKNSKLSLCPLPPMRYCTRILKLVGPYSPLEVSLNGVSRFFVSKVNVDQNSVNSVILEDDIVNYHSKFYVACNVTANQSNKSLVIHNVTMMPPTPGLAVILALIFSPTAELRRDSFKSRYISLLTGLGYDGMRKNPFYGEHDTSLNIDFKLDEEDIENINKLRNLMSAMLHTQKNAEFTDLVEDEKVKILLKIQEKIQILITKNRAFRAVTFQPDPFDWGVDQSSLPVSTEDDPYGLSAIFSAIKVPNLIPMAESTKQKLKIHAIELAKASQGSMVIHNKFCHLCGFAFDSLADLKFHLKTMKHINSVAELEN